MNAFDFQVSFDANVLYLEAPRKVKIRSLEL